MGKETSSAENITMTPSAIPDIPGYRRLSRFHKRGGMGVLYHGYSEKTGQEVVIKLMDFGDSLEDYDHNRSRFAREITLANILGTPKHEHPNVLAAIEHGDILEYSSHQPRPYLVYPYIKDDSLAELLEKETPWSNPSWSLLQIADIIMQAAEGLSHLHDFGFVHQDVKPNNFLCSSVDPTQPLRRVHIWLIDFGAAEPERKTRSLTIIGTPGYIAPEQLDKYIKRSADQYSLAVMARLLLTGSHPPISGSLGHTLYTPLTQLNPKRLHEQEIDRVVLKALALHPEDRFGTVLEFAQALQKAILLQEPLTFYTNPTKPLQPSSIQQYTNTLGFHQTATGQASPINSLPSAQPRAKPPLPAQEPPLAKPRIKSFTPHRPVNEILPAAPQKPFSIPHPVPSLPTFRLQKLFAMPLPNWPTMLAWSPDDTALVCTFSEDAPRLIYSNHKVEILSDFRYGHCACWSPDSRFLAISVYDEARSRTEIRFWDSANSTKGRYPPLQFHSETTIYGLDWSSTGHLALWLESKLLVYNLSTLSAQAQLLPPHITLPLRSSMHSERRTTLRWSPDGTWLAAGANNGKVLCWNLYTSTLLEQNPCTKSVSGVSWSPDSQILVAASINKHIMFWDLRTGQTIQWDALPEMPTMLSVSPQTAELAVATKKKTLFFGRIGDSAPTASHPGQQLVAWSPTNKLATLDKDDVLVIWQAH